MLAGGHTSDLLGNYCGGVERMDGLQGIAQKLDQAEEGNTRTQQRAAELDRKPGLVAVAELETFD